MKLYLTLLAAGLCLAAVGCDQGAGSPAAGRSMIVAVQHSPWASSQSNGEILTSANYQVYTTSRSRQIVQFLPGFMEAARQNYLELTGLPDCPAPQLLPIYMMSTRQEWISLSEQIFGSDPRQAFHSIEAGGYCYKGVCVFWDLGGIQTFSVASHEGLHQYLHHRLQNPLPLWLEEGLCSAAEGHEIRGDRVRFTPDRNNSRFTGLRTTIVNQYWMKIRELLPLSGPEVAVKGTEHAVGYYSQLWALALFLRSHPTYRSGLERMMNDAEAGRFAQALQLPPALANIRQRTAIYNRSLAEPLFTQYITRDLDGFDREYQAFARKLAGLEY